MLKVTHSAALEPPAGSAYCEDCEFTSDYCRCGDPSCEDCGHYADRLIKVDDVEGWACNDCAKKYEEVA